MVNQEGKEMGQRPVELKREIRLALNGRCCSSYDSLNGLVKSILSVNL